MLKGFFREQSPEGAAMTSRLPSNKGSRLEADICTEVLLEIISRDEDCKKAEIAVQSDSNELHSALKRLRFVFVSFRFQKKQLTLAALYE